MAGTDRSAAMPLNAHLRELRSRLLKSGVAVAIGMVVGWVYYTQIFDWISAPFNDVVNTARAQGREITLALTGVADPFVLQLQVASVAGIILSSPVWLYQLWRFITPGLHRHERRWGFGFVLVATPLFAAGVWMAYSVLPVGLNLLFGFTPDGAHDHGVLSWVPSTPRTYCIEHGGHPRRQTLIELVALDNFRCVHFRRGGYTNWRSHQHDVIGDTDFAVSHDCHHLLHAQ